MSKYILRGYAERQKVHAVHVEGQFVEVFLTPQNLGGGKPWYVRVAIIYLFSIAQTLGTVGLVGDQDLLWSRPIGYPSCLV